MRSVRWRKLAGDLRAAWGRLLAMQLAIALALAGVGTALGARTVLAREISASYVGTAPADATLELPAGVDDALLAELRARPGIAAVDRRQTVHVRVKLAPDDPWQMLVLFVPDRFDALRLATFSPETGAWPPPRGSLLLERTAPAVMGLGALAGDERVIVQGPHGAPAELAIAGTVHDAGQAPNWQEHRGCGYASRETLAMLGDGEVLHELLIQFSPSPDSTTDAEHAAAELAGWLRAHGHEVHEVRVPKLRQHPHQGLMNAVQLVMLVFSLLLLVLCAIVVATMLSSMLARQTREIGVMKAVGARTGQLAGIYLGFVAALGLVACAIALPLAAAASHAMIVSIGAMMNLTLADPGVPAWVPLATAAVGVGVPVAVALLPILRATRITVRRALSSHGAGFRTAFRRPGRLAVTMTLLVASGALVMTGANVQRGLSAISDQVEDARRYDLEVRLHDPIAPDRLADLRDVAGVRAIEAWQSAPAAIGDIVHTYPDGGHGSAQLVAPPVGGSRLVELPLTSGRWLRPDDTDDVVLGGRATLGERITVTTDGHASTWTVVGTVAEMPGGSLFVTPAAFARATGSTGVRLLRIATDADPRPVLAALEARLAGDHLAVDYAIPTPLMHSIIDDHVALVVRAVIAMAALVALVGLFGLGSAMAVSVAERTRELGILKAIGATEGRILRMVAGEAAFVGAACSVLGALLALPLTYAVDAHLTGTFFAPPRFEVSLAVLALWPPVVVAGSVLACLAPALRAARLSVRAALGQV